jgi:hypothetical protein
MARRRKPGEEVPAAPKRQAKTPAKAPVKSEAKKPKRAVLGYMREMYECH